MLSNENCLYFCNLKNNSKSQKQGKMTVREIATLVQGDILGGEEYQDRQVERIFASDLMSDVLTLKDYDNLMLVTGLCNLQSIRTCEMSDIQMILVVRGKEVTPEMLELAEDNEMIVVRTAFSMYKTAGILYGAGIPPVY
jgi:predicted transcriptional regulator